MEKMNNRSIIRAPTLARDGKVIIMVLKMTLKNFAFVINLKILPILNARATVAYFGPKWLLVVYPIIKVT
jgi:hypothetical protein